jgi:hypothetical protein
MGPELAPDRAVGQGRLDKTAGFHLEARGLTIQPETGNATGRVLLASTRVQVAAGVPRRLEWIDAVW